MAIEINCSLCDKAIVNWDERRTYEGKCYCQDCYEIKQHKKETSSKQPDRRVIDENKTARTGSLWCAICNRPIATRDEHYIFEGSLLCKECKITKSAEKNKTELIKALVMFTISLIILGYYIFSQCSASLK